MSGDVLFKLSTLLSYHFLYYGSIFKITFIGIPSSRDFLSESHEVHDHVSFLEFPPPAYINNSNVLLNQLINLVC